jgi:hypothetical protein
VLVLALPDSGPRVVTLSEDHGPSAVDLVGVVLLVAAWMVPATVVWRRRSRLLALPVGARAAGVAVAAAGAAILVTSIAGDAGAWWMLGAALLALAQVAAFMVAIRA